MHCRGGFKPRSQGIGADAAHVGKTMAGQRLEVQTGDLELKSSVESMPTAFSCASVKALMAIGTS